MAYNFLLDGERNLFHKKIVVWKVSEFASAGGESFRRFNVLAFERFNVGSLIGLNSTCPQFF
jgi:hypothetical protein